MFLINDFYFDFLSHFLFQSIFVPRVSSFGQELQDGLIFWYNSFYQLIDVSILRKILLY